VSEQINMTELLKERYTGPQAYLLTSLLGLVSVPSMPNVLTEKNADGKIIWDVKLTINGIEVSFIDLLARWDEGMDAEIQNKVEDAIPDAVTKAVQQLQERVNQIDEHLGDWVEELVREAEGNGT
jgi:hypothetical protein